MLSPQLIFGPPDHRAPLAAGLYFQLDDEPGPDAEPGGPGPGGIGRVSFESAESVRFCAGEYLPYEEPLPEGPSDGADAFAPYPPGEYPWVYTVDDSEWLRERQDYERKHYGTALRGEHRHFVFRFHDEYAEAIAAGIWFDEPDAAAPYAPPVGGPMASLDAGLLAEQVTVGGRLLELRTSPVPVEALTEGSRLCSQRLYQFDFADDGREFASIWLRTRNGRLTSHLVKFAPYGETVRRIGLVGPDDFDLLWRLDAEAPPFWKRSQEGGFTEADLTRLPEDG